MIMANLNPLENLVGDMKHVGQIDQAAKDRWRDGRVGICILALGFMLMRNGAELLCPRKDMPGSIWLPGYWQRRHVMYTSVFLFVILLCARLMITHDHSHSSFIATLMTTFIT